MSHSLHRYGTVEDLKNDFCIYSRAARGVNRENCGDKLRRILSIYISEEIVNFGSSHSGSSYIAGLDPKEYAKTLDNSYGIIATFSKRQAVLGVLKKMKEANIGISVVVSGLIDEVTQVAYDAGLKPHTATISLGIYGKKKLLPENEVLKVVTMCGHSLVGSQLVCSVREDIKRGAITPDEGVKILAKPCTCGIFNTVRCLQLFGAKEANPDTCERSKQ